MSTLIMLLKILHIVTAILMAWPFYALVTVNQRARLGLPLGDRADAYMENIIRNRARPCFIFQATAMVSGLSLILARGMGLDVLISNPSLGIKFMLLALIAALLSYVHFRLQPRLDALFAQAGSPVSPETAAQIQALRRRRKRLASICLCCVLTMAMLGVQVWAVLPVWLTLIIVALIVVFAWRAYSSAMSWGWA